MSFDRKHFDTEGPLGFPLKERQARALEAVLKAQPRGPEYEYRRAQRAAAATEVNPGERSDVSWISTETLDRVNEVVVARGMNDAQFAHNPVVTLNHSYQGAPVGRSLWRKVVKDGAVRGIKAKTQYPPQPAAWPAGQAWPSDAVFALVQAGLLNGKSVGFLPLKVHFPDAAEAGQNGWPADTLVIDQWLLLEYAVCPFGVNQEALVEAVSKSAAPLPVNLLKALGVSAPAAEPAGAVPGLVRFTPLAEIERALQLRLETIDVQSLAQDRLDRARGRV